MDRLAIFFRSLAFTPSSYPSAVESARTSTTLEFFDNDLYRTHGARTLLNALRANPLTDRLSASQNSLEDDGVRVFCEGMRGLRAEGVGECLRELNLSGNGLTDLSLQHLITHLLADVPTLTHLYLNNNSIALANPQIVTSLACTLSSPRSTLRALSLTSNSAIDAASLGRLLRELDLGKGSNFEQLHFSVCSLGPDAVSPLVSFLESPERGGNERLQVLALNANSLYDIGVRRIARIVSSGRNVGLLSLELLANQPADDTGMKADWAEILAELELEEARNGGVDNEWKDGLTRGLERNRRLFRETRICALGMLGKGRVLFGGRPREGEEETAFPFLRLPIELQVHVYRCSLLLDPSNEAHLYTRRPSPPFPSPSILSSPLTESQFLHLLAHVASEDTFATEIRLATPKAVEGEEGRVLGGGTGKVGMNERGEESWAEWALWSVGCDRFMLG